MKISGHHSIIGDYITLKELAKYLKLHPQTLRRWDREGKLKAEKIGPHNVYNIEKMQRRINSGIL